MFQILAWNKRHSCLIHNGLVRKRNKVQQKMYMVLCIAQSSGCYIFGVTLPDTKKPTQCLVAVLSLLSISKFTWRSWTKGTIRPLRRGWALSNHNDWWELYWWALPMLRKRRNWNRLTRKNQVLCEFLLIRCMMFVNVSLSQAMPS